MTSPFSKSSDPRPGRTPIQSEPDAEWIDRTRKHIEEKLQSSVNAAKKTHRSRLQETQDPKKREAIENDLKAVMNDIIKLASEQLMEAIDRRRQELRWVADHTVEAGWSDALAKEQQAILNDIQRKGSMRSQERPPAQRALDLANAKFGIATQQLNGARRDATTGPSTSSRGHTSSQYPAQAGIWPPRSVSASPDRRRNPQGGEFEIRRPGAEERIPTPTLNASTSRTQSVPRGSPVFTRYIPAEVIRAGFRPTEPSEEQYDFPASTSYSDSSPQYKWSSPRPSQPQQSPISKLPKSFPQVESPLQRESSPVAHRSGHSPFNSPSLPWGIQVSNPSSEVARRVVSSQTVNMEDGTRQTQTSPITSRPGSIPIPAPRLGSSLSQDYFGAPRSHRAKPLFTSEKSITSQGSPPTGHYRSAPNGLPNIQAPQVVPRSSGSPRRSSLRSPSTGSERWTSRTEPELYNPMMEASNEQSGQSSDNYSGNSDWEDSVFDVEALEQRRAQLEKDEATAKWADQVSVREEKARKQAEQAQRKVDEARRKEEASKKKEDARQKQEEIKQKQAARRKEEEVNRREAEVNRREEEINRREEKVNRREEEAKRRQKEAKRREEEAERREEEAERREEEAERREEEAERREEEVSRREEETKRREEDIKQRVAELKRPEQEEKNRKEDETRREAAVAEMKRLEDEKLKAEQEAHLKRMQDIEVIEALELEQVETRAWEEYVQEQTILEARIKQENARQQLEAERRQREQQPPKASQPRNLAIDARARDKYLQDQVAWAEAAQQQVALLQEQEQRQKEEEQRRRLQMEAQRRREEEPKRDEEEPKRDEEHERAEQQYRQRAAEALQRADEARRKAAEKRRQDSTANSSESRGPSPATPQPNPWSFAHR